MNRTFLRTPEVAKQTGLSVGYVNLAIKEGKLKATRSGGHWRIRPRHVRQWRDRIENAHALQGKART